MEGLTFRIGDEEFATADTITRWPVYELMDAYFSGNEARQMAGFHKFLRTIIAADEQPKFNAYMVANDFDLSVIDDACATFLKDFGRMGKGEPSPSVNGSETTKPGVRRVSFSPGSGQERSTG